MSDIHSPTLDLNLLRIFHRIYLQRSVSVAAEQLGLTQSALSHALKKLRLTFNDELFIRAKHGLVPTSRAESLFESVERVMATVEREIVPEACFDAALSKRQFRLSMNDIAQVAFFKPFLFYTGQHAPGCSFVSRHISNEAVAQALEEDLIDLAIGNFPDFPTTFYQQTLYQNDYVVLAWEGHPRLKGRLTWEEFVKEEHVVVASASDRYFQKSTLDPLGIQRRVHLTVEGFLSVPWLLKGTDLLATVPTQLNDAIAKAAAVAQLPVPQSAKPYRLQSMWHPRLHNDPGHRWLRETIFSLVKAPQILGT